MAVNPSFQVPQQGGVRKWIIIGVLGLVAMLGAWLLYRLLTDIDGIAVKSAPPTVVDMLPPPPPPPPPPPQERPPEPLEKSVPDPVQQPTPDKPAPAPMQIDGPAQAGGDAYGMTAGSGGGMGAPAATGLCTGPNCGTRGGVPGTDRFWGRNVANALEDYIQASRKVNVDSFVGEFSIVVTDGGMLTQAQMLRSTGDSKLDQTILALLQSARGLKPPPASIRMPQRVKIGRKRL